MLTLNHGIMKAQALLFNCQDGGIRVLDVGGGGEGVLLQEGARALFGVVQVRIKLIKLNIQLDNDNSVLVCLLRRHTRGEELPGLLTVVPDCLTSRVCLYRFVPKGEKAEACVNSSISSSFNCLPTISISHILGH